MKLKYSILALSMFTMFSCNLLDNAYNELDKNEVGNVKHMEEQVLTAVDYEAIAKIVKSDETVANFHKSWYNSFKDNQMFNAAVAADKFLPTYAAQTYFTWEKGSSVAVTYNRANVVNIPFVNANYADISGIEHATYMAVPASVNGNEVVTSFFNKYYSASKNGDFALAALKTSPTPILENLPVFIDDFNDGVKNWTLANVQGTYKWEGKDFKGNYYVQNSAFRHEGALDSWMITPEVTVENGMSFNFELKWAHHKGNPLSVLVAENGFTKTADNRDSLVVANWTKLAVTFHEPTASGFESGFTKYKVDLSSYAGNDLQIAIRYEGSGATGGITTTAQLDNVHVSALKPGEDPFPVVSDSIIGLTFANNAWSIAADSIAYKLDTTDYQTMGQEEKFGSLEDANFYLPKFLKANNFYSPNGDRKIVICDIDKLGQTALAFKLVNGDWESNNYETIVKEKYVNVGEKWIFDPTILVNFAEADYKAVVDWVTENKSAYLDPKYSDSEYWFGASYNYNNFNNQVIKRRSNDPEEILKDMSDEEVIEYLTEQTAKGIIVALEANHSDIPAKDKDGLDQMVKVAAHIYDGGHWKYTYEFKSLGGGQFEYTGEMLKEAW